MSLASPGTPLLADNGPRAVESSNAVNDEDLHNPQIAEVRKDKRRILDVSHLERFTIRSYSSSVYDKPFVLQPLRLLRRSQLPLSFLDLSSGRSSLPLNRLFSATITILENRDDADQQCWLDPIVLLSCLESNGSLYVVERVQDGIYALGKLAGWVKVTTFDDLTPHKLNELIQRKMGAAGMVSSNKRRTSTALRDMLPSTDTERPAKRSKLSVPPPPNTEKPMEKVATGVESKTGSKTPKKKAKQSPVKESDAQGPLQLSSEVVFATLVKHYLEALYWSKNSLAFFTKGPLSRARASFSASASEKMVLTDLTSFLRSMLLEVKSMDKKYRDKLPDMIKAFPPSALSEDEDAPPSTTKRKKPKRPKLSKDGLYPFEEDYVKRWWASDDSGPDKIHQGDTAQDILRKRLADLRSRETFAQIILILEIMALESSTISKAAESPNGNPQEVEQLENQKPRKKTVDLNLLLDLLLDKLSIWQSIEQVSGNRQKSNSQTAQISSEKPVDQDILGTFCIEVIVPFYKSRLPVKSAEVVKKLSGQVDSLDKKPKSRAPKPGEPISKDKVPQKERRRLQKTASDTQVSFRPPSLLRSATDSIIKREMSEVPLSAIPQLRDSRPPSRSRQPSIHLQHLNRRQIDLNELSVATDAKLKRKAAIEDELKEAITALKKPNRGLAIKDYVEAAKQREIMSTGKRKQHPSRRVLQNVENVQIMATPRNSRKVNVFAPKEPEQTMPDTTDEALAPSSGYVPASSIRLTSQAAPSDLQPYSKPSGTVAETPSKRPTKTLSFFPSAISGTPDRNKAVSTFKIPCSALRSMDRVSGIENTPSKQRHQQASSANKSLMAKSNAFAQIMQTPTKQKVQASTDAITSTPIQSETMLDGTHVSGKATAVTGMGVAEEKRNESIYDALGWNYVDELA